MFSSLLLAVVFPISVHISAKSDTVPKGQAPAFATEGDRQVYEMEVIFHDHYKPQSYPLFKGSIIRVAPATYRFDSFTMRTDSLAAGTIDLLSRGLLYPGLIGPIFGSTDSLWIANLSEPQGLSPSPQQRRFSCWVFNTQMANPVWYVFELTNQHGTSDMDTKTFFQDARLTFLYQVSIII